MEILGVGGAELVLILLIMLIVAGPKRMIRWAFILGQYTAKLRAMWAESMTYLQAELKEAGMDVELPKQPPTRASLNRQIAKALDPVVKPVQDAMEETNLQMSQIKQNVTFKVDTGNGRATKDAAQSSSDDSASNLGTWSGQVSSSDE